MQKLREHTKDLFELASVHYSDKLSILTKACSLLERKIHNSELFWYQDSVCIALILCKMRVDFSVILSSLFYLSAKLNILSVKEYNAVCDQRALGHIKWLLHIGDFKEFCIEFLNQSKNGDTYKDLDPQRLAILLAFFVHKVRHVDLLNSTQEKESLALDGVDIYSAFAEKIGMPTIKQEIEDAALKILNPDARASIIEILDNFSEEYKSVAKYVTNKLEKKFISVGIESQIFWRQKSPYSIWLKMLKKNQSFDNIVDVLGLRILVYSVEECYQVLSIIHSDNIIIPGFFDDFISIPKPNGYQSIHTVILGPLEHKIEIQIRTHQMQEQSEQGAVAHWVYKNQIHKNLILDHKGLEPLSSKSFPAREEVGVFCILTDGSKVYLPHGGIVLDVAFKISYSVGMSCIGAKINGSTVSLLRKVCNGDRVEILTSEWYEIHGMEQSYIVDPEIRDYFKKYFLDKVWSQSVYAGGRTLRNLCNLFRVSSFDRFLENLTKNLGFVSEEELLSKVGKGDLPISKLIDFVDQHDNKDVSIRVKFVNFIKLCLAKCGISLFKKVHFTYGQAILAKCCNPIPGDDVIGCFSIKDGFIVHWIKCPLLDNLSTYVKIVPIKLTDPERDRVYLTYLKVMVLNDEVSLEEISSVMSKFGASISNMQTDECSREVVYAIKVCDVAEVDTIVSQLNKDCSAFHVTRVRHND